MSELIQLKLTDESLVPGAEIKISKGTGSPLTILLRNKSDQETGNARVSFGNTSKEVPIPVNVQVPYRIERHTMEVTVLNNGITDIEVIWF